MECKRWKEYTHILSKHKPIDGDPIDGIVCRVSNSLFIFLFSHVFLVCGIRTAYTPIRIINFFLRSIRRISDHTIGMAFA